MRVLKKSAYLPLAIATLLVSANSYAYEHKYYLQINAGATFLPDNAINTMDLAATNHIQFDYDPGFATGAALGFHLTENIRLEGEFMYQANDFNNSFISSSGAVDVQIKGERNRKTFLFNTYFDFVNRTAFTPYITAGVGGHHIEFDSDTYNLHNDFDVAFQGGAGINYALNDRLSLDLKYRYFSGNVPQLRKVGAQFSELFDVGDHQIMAGLRIGF